MVGFFVCNRNSKWYLFKILGNYSCIQISMKTYTSTGPLFTSPGDFSDLTWCQTTRRKPSDPRVLTASSCWAPCQNIKSASNLVIWALLSDQQMRGLDDHFPQWRAKGCNQSLAVVFFDWTNIQQTFLLNTCWCGECWVWTFEVDLLTDKQCHSQGVSFGLTMETKFVPLTICSS